MTVPSAEGKGEEEENTGEGETSASKSDYPDEGMRAWLVVVGGIPPRASTHSTYSDFVHEQTMASTFSMYVTPALSFSVHRVSVSYLSIS